MKGKEEKELVRGVQSDPGDNELINILKTKLILRHEKLSLKIGKKSGRI